MKLCELLLSKWEKARRSNKWTLAYILVTLAKIILTLTSGVKVRRGQAASIVADA
jgi:hypothetical protein